MFLGYVQMYTQKAQQFKLFKPFQYVNITKIHDCKLSKL